MKHLTPGGQTVATMGLVFPSVNRLPYTISGLSVWGEPCNYKTSFSQVTAGEGGRAYDS